MNPIGLQGVEVLPHPDCDPVRLEFDEDLHIQEFTKTRFAGAATHVEVIELLRRIAPFFAGSTWRTTPKLGRR